MNPRVFARLRTGVTLLVLLGLVAWGVNWGWASLTEPLPGSEPAGTCTDLTLAKGDKLYPDQLVVSVLNAGNQAGKASRVMSQLERRGFSRGDLANAPGGSGVVRVQIWTDRPRSPEVRLLKTYLGGKRTTVTRRDPVTDGINIVIGNQFGKVGKGRKRVPVKKETTVCAPASAVDTGDTGDTGDA